MQQKQQQSQQCDKPVVEQAVSQLIAAVAADQKKQVSQDYPQEMNVVVILQPQDPFDNKERQLKGNAVILMGKG